MNRVLIIVCASLALAMSGSAQNQQSWFSGSLLLAPQARRSASLGITNLVAHWLMNDNAANKIIADNYTNNLAATATTNTSAMTTTGKINASLGFGGANTNNARVADNTALKPDYVSYGAWVYRTNGTSSARIIEKGSAGVDYALLSSSDGYYGLIYDNLGGYIQNYPGYSLPLNEWHHLFVVYDGAAGTLKMYVDGILLRTDNGSAGRTCQKTTGSLYIGQALSGIAFFNGSIDDMRIYSRALASNEVYAIYNGGVGTEAE